MGFNGSADSAQLDILQQALDRYCAKHGLDERRRDDIAYRVMALHSTGLNTGDEIVAALENSDADDARRHAS